MATNHNTIQQLLDNNDKNADTSLRAQSMRRALKLQVPTTLTAYEWERWYAEHGVPDSHKVTGKKVNGPWWRFW